MTTFGCTFNNRGPLATPENLRTLATRAEELGFDHLWVSDHIVVPTQIASPYPYAPTGDAPFASRETYCEPLAALCYLAACTQRIKLGTHVLVLPYREPVLTAKIVSTLDYMSGGRVILGIGVGWMEEEFKALGLDTFAERGAVSDEYIRIFKELWTKEDPEFQGRYSQFSGIHFYPKPVQKPHPPIWVGGHTTQAIRRAARLGDGWLPIGLRPPAELEPEEMADLTDRLRDMTEKEGRPREEVDVVFSANVSFRSPASAPGPNPTLTGSAEEVGADIVLYQQVGVQHFIFGFEGDTTEQILENMERFAKEVRPQVA
jgi:probable F420-dependent oxidoreductase